MPSKRKGTRNKQKKHDRNKHSGTLKVKYMQHGGFVADAEVVNALEQLQTNIKSKQQAQASFLQNLAGNANELEQTTSALKSSWSTLKAQVDATKSSISESPVLSNSGTQTPAAQTATNVGILEQALNTCQRQTSTVATTAETETAETGVGTNAPADDEIQAAKDALASLQAEIDEYKARGQQVNDLLQSLSTQIDSMDTSTGEESIQKLTSVNAELKSLISGTPETQGIFSRGATAVRQQAGEIGTDAYEAVSAATGAVTNVFTGAAAGPEGESSPKNNYSESDNPLGEISKEANARRAAGAQAGDEADESSAPAAGESSAAAAASPPPFLNLNQPPQVSSSSEKSTDKRTPTFYERFVSGFRSTTSNNTTTPKAKPAAATSITTNSGSRSTTPTQNNNSKSIELQPITSTGSNPSESSNQPETDTPQAVGGPQPGGPQGVTTAVSEIKKGGYKYTKSKKPKRANKKTKRNKK